MRERNRSGRAGRRRSGGDGEQDLFTKQLSKIVEHAFATTATTDTEAKPREAAPEAPVENQVVLPPLDIPDAQAEAVAPQGAEFGTSLGQPEVEVAIGNGALLQDTELGAIAEDEDAPKVELPVESIPARMLNEFVYCPRLYYYEHVEGVFVESADTVKGATVHARVDRGSGAMPKAKAAVKSEEEEGEGKPAADGEEIHSRSVMLGSERLGVVAKMDLVEATLDEAGSVAAVCPVDYKVGSPREGEDGRELWDTDRMQLGLQCLVLRDNGYACNAGIIYYRGTKQRVRLELTPELEAWVIAQIAAARETALGSIPPPLVDSPKCARCSLAPVCLPDETRMLSVPTLERFSTDEEGGGAGESAVISQHSPSTAPRRLLAPRDEKRALYLNTQGFRVGCNDAVIKVKEKDRVVEEVRVGDVCHVAIFGNIQVSTQAVQRFCDRDIPVTWFSMGGWFYGMTRGHSLKNVLLRIEQFRHAADPVSCLGLARQFVRGKIHNHRVLFMRNHAEPPERTKLRLGQAREDALAVHSLEELLGVEGAAASGQALSGQRDSAEPAESWAAGISRTSDTLAVWRSASGTYSLKRSRWRSVNSMTNWFRRARHRQSRPHHPRRQRSHWP